MKSYQCNFCSKNWRNLSLLEIHLRVHTKECPFTCSICKKSYGRKSTLMSHINTHKINGRSHKCNQCPLAFSVAGHLKKHLINVHNVLNLPKEECPTCGKVFTKGIKMRSHQLRVHTKLEKQHQCIICNKWFMDIHQLMKHLRIHTGEKPATMQQTKQQCIICKKWFMDFQILLQHLRVHTREKPFYCPKCPASFSLGSQQKGHLIRKHDVGVRLRCPVCNKSTCYKRDLEVHMRSHTNERPFSCSMCSKTFASATTLRNHEGVHKTKEGRLWCKICQKRFTNLSYYNVHIQRHKQNRLKYQCSECPMTFQYNSRLDKHVKQKHRQVRPFSCNICERSFQTSCNRDQHINTHLKETPHKCEICGKQFRCLGSLTTHLKTVHAQNSQGIRCSKCPLILRSEFESSRHYLLEHVNSYADFLKCIFCSFRARCLRELEYHYTKYTRERPYFCKNCPQSFGRLEDLRRHLKIVHNI